VPEAGALAKNRAGCSRPSPGPADDESMLPLAYKTKGFPGDKEALFDVVPHTWKIASKRWPILIEEACFARAAGSRPWSGRILPNATDCGRLSSRPGGCRSGRPNQLVGRCVKTCLGGRGGCCATLPLERWHCLHAAFAVDLYGRAGHRPAPGGGARSQAKGARFAQVKGGRFCLAACARPGTHWPSNHRSGICLNALIQNLLALHDRLKIHQTMKSG